MTINTAAVVAGELVTAAKWNTMRGDLLGLDGKLIGWTSYTPVLSGAGWAKGTSGSDAAGAYCETNGVVFFWAGLVTGTGATFATNAPFISLPFAVDAAQYGYASMGSVAGFIYALSANTLFRCEGVLANFSVVKLRAINSTTNYAYYTDVSNTVPMTWAVGDYLGLSGWYRKAP